MEYGFAYFANTTSEFQTFLKEMKNESVTITQYLEEVMTKQTKPL